MTIRRPCHSLSLASPLGLVLAAPARAVDAPSFLAGLHRYGTVASTVPPNGDQPPCAVAVPPVTRDRLIAGHVPVSKFNDARNLQGLGTTLVPVDPAMQTLSLFAAVPQTLDRCPGGVGMTTAMAVLRSGWVVVGSLPSRDGTTATKGDGCLLLLDADGRLADISAGPRINGSWGNMAVIDRGDSATLLFSNTGYGVGAAPDHGDPPVMPKATVVRLDLAGGRPVPRAMTVAADGFGEQADKGAFIIGPTGVALGPDGSIYVSDAIGNRIVQIPDALTRTTSAGTGIEVMRDGFINRPLAPVDLPNNDLLVTNGLNGQMVEIDWAARRQVAAQWVDVDRAQQPAGSGHLFGLATAPGGGFHYVEDDVNTLVLAH